MRTELNTRETCLSMTEMTGYLSNELNTDQETLVDEHLKVCELCCGALESLEQELLTFNSGLTEQAVTMESEFLEVLENVRPAKSQFNWSRNLLKYAAIIVLAIIPAYLLFLNYDSSESEVLYSKYFNPYDDLITVRSGKQDDLLQQAMSYYNEANYENALDLLEEAREKDLENQLLTLYCGIASLELKKEDKAITYFRLLSDQGGLLSNHARWYLALTYLRSKNVDATIEILNQLSQSDNAHRQEARELLEQL